MNHEDTLCYYTVPEVAKLLKVSKSYIYDLILQGKLESIKFSERRTRISSLAIKKLTEEKLDNLNINHYNKIVVQPPKRGRRPNGSIKK
ncbi:helix-turn-helix transcriptional regulator [Dehalobacter restrictus]|uniref:Helix-turn-helix domain-containing protein n=1 Tax=Dehalobacter restrictus TaxID=55583 RepID=A0A857DNA7_9FIRM|nr:helix-turn-helix domain-containing protein [Dehalobacter restrictus]QHA01835.1 helix-turn-helix domain-containing protein [Dehalobacter restrictus]